MTAQMTLDQAKAILAKVGAKPVNQGCLQLTAAEMQELAFAKNVIAEEFDKLRHHYLRSRANLDCAHARQQNDAAWCASIYPAQVKERIEALKERG
jgi:hypothetical protein